MTQFRAIPIEWGLSEEKYFKFLMWVSFRATFKGWDRCDALQVTFTVREAASRFGVSVSTVSGWVATAKKSGILLPTNQSATERGKGEVYSLGGDMLMTVKTAEQAPNKLRTSSEQPSVDYIVPCDDGANNNRTSSEQVPNVNKVYSPYSPTTKASSPSRARQSRKKDESIPLPEDLVPVVDYLISSWPPVSYEKGSSRSVQIYMREDLWARVAHLAGRFGKVPGAILFCGLPYVRRILKDAEDTGKPVFVKNMSNFWGIKEDNRMWEEAYNQGLIDYQKFMEKAGANNGAK